MYKVWMSQDEIGWDGEYPRVFIAQIWGYKGTYYRDGISGAYKPVAYDAKMYA